MHIIPIHYDVDTKAWGGYDVRTTHKEEAMRISPFVKCPCGKLHIVLPMLNSVIKCPVCFTDLIDVMLRVTK